MKEMEKKYWVVVVTVKEYYSVQAESREDAIVEASNKGDPYQVTVIGKSIKIDKRPYNKTP